MTTLNGSGSPTKPGRTYETVARLDISADGTQAELSAQSPKPNADLILSGKGTGQVYVEGQTGKEPVLTPQNLADAIADGVEVEVINALIQVALQDTAFAESVRQLQKAVLQGAYTSPEDQEFLNQLFAGSASLNPYISGAIQKIGSTAETADTNANFAFELAIVVAQGITGKPNPTAAEVTAALTGLGGGGLDEAAVNGLIGAALAGITAMIMPILDGHTTDIAGLDAKIKTVQGLVANLVGEIAALAAGGAGGGIDQAALEAAVQAATATFTANLAAETQQREEADLNLQTAYQFIQTNKADQVQHQGLINALCSAPFTSMTGNAVNNLAKVGVWVGIVKQEIENLEANLTFAYDKTVENKTAIAALQAENATFKARLDALEAENTKLKSDVKTASQNAAFAMGEVERLQQQDVEIFNHGVETYAEKQSVEYLQSSLTDLIQEFMDAINGPNATTQNIQEMFWLLNDIIGALMAATGVELPREAAIIGSEQ